VKIICIGRNYAEHAKELKNDLPTEPVVFLKPDTALIPKKQPFFIPDFSEEVHFETELVIKIDRIGKHIAPKFAHKYFSEVSLGIDFTARDLQQDLKSKGLPWEKAKAFDGSAPVGKFISKDSIPSLNQLNFELKINGETRQLGNTKDMIFSVDEIIAYVSKFFTLKIGYLIFTGTPAGVAKVEKDDLLEAFIGDNKVLKLQVK
jgi:2-keto-4-pentenoate hydratase/2-oxohepta-3-ene-1,7-dioic acid hydratase in catechol pathway